MNIRVAKWLEIIRFELGYQLRRKAAWFFFLIFLMMLMGQTNGQALDALDDDVLFNAPILIAKTSVTMILVGLLVLSAIAGDAATRDVQLRIEALMHAAPVGRIAYFSGRFFGAFVVIALLLLAVPLAVLLGTVLHPDLTAATVGPFRLAPYLESYLLLIVPNAFVTTALLFALASLVRHTMGSYLAAVLVLGGSILSRQIIGRTLSRWDLAQLFDPTAITAIEVLSKSWSPVELNGRLVSTASVLWWNRLLWIAVAFGVLAFTYSRFRFGGNTRRRWWQRATITPHPPSAPSPLTRGEGLQITAVARLRAPSSVAPLPLTPSPRSSSPVSPSRRSPLPLSPPQRGEGGRRPGEGPLPTEKRATLQIRLRQTLTITRDSLREMVTGWSWLILPFLFLQIATSSKMLGFLGTPYLPTTGRVLESFGGTLNLLLVFVVLFAGELVWRERDANIQSLVDTVPVPNAVRFGGKLLGLWLVIAILHAVMMLAGALLQVRYGYTEFEPGLYVRILFGLALLEAFTFALLALSVHVVINHKHVGHGVVLLLVLTMRGLLPGLGIEHPLLIFGADPGWRYSPISGFEPHLAPFLWFESYWTAWTLLLAIVAYLFWTRGVELGTRDRLRLARRRLTGRTAAFAAAAIALLLCVGGSVFYNTNVLNEYRTSAELAQRRADYERRYSRYANAPQPQMTATELHAELYPERRAAGVRGIYHLTNRTAKPIDTIHVAISPHVETQSLNFNRRARATLIDDDYGHRIYTLEPPLDPGEALQLHWQIRYAARGFTTQGIDPSVIGNGSFIVMHNWMPQLGYQRQRELSGTERKEHGLPERPEVAPLHDIAARHDSTGQERFHVKVTAGTSLNQMAVGPGPLRRTWTRGARRYFEYATAAPIGHGYAIFSANYAVRKAQAGNTAIEVIHHPEHTLNVERMTRGMQASLAQFTKRFGPYPHEVLRMVERQSDGGGAHAATTTIWYEELFSLFDPASDDRRIDVPFAVVAHETAHQFQATPARVEGSGLLSESFAWYAAMGVIEQEHGTAHLQRFLGFMRRAYLDPRSRADVPLLRASDWFKSYRNGPFAMYALREYIGQDRVDLAWRRMFDKHRSGHPPYATSLELLHELQQVTPIEHRPLLADLLERNTFWELKATTATAQRAANGRWRVTLEVSAQKVAVDEEGAETNMPMNDLVEIGVFGSDPVKPLYKAMHRIRTGTQTIVITVPIAPVRAGIDPRLLLIDVQPDDNVVDIQKVVP